MFLKVITIVAATAMIAESIPLARNDSANTRDDLNELNIYNSQTYATRPGQDPDTFSLRTEYINLALTQGSTTPLKVGFRSDIKANLITSNNSANWTPSWVGASITQDGYKGNIVSTNATFYRGVCGGPRNTISWTNKTILSDNPSWLNINAIYTDSELPGGYDVLLSILPNNPGTPLQTFMTSIGLSGLIPNKLALFDAKNEIVEFGTEQFTTYSWQSIVSCTPGINNDTPPYVYNWTTVKTIPGGSTMKFNTTLTLPRNVSSKAYLASFDFTSPYTLVPRELAQTAWAAYNVTQEKKVGPHYSYTRPDGRVPLAPFIFTVPDTPSVKLSVQGDQAPSYIFGHDKDEIVFGGNMFEGPDSTAFLFDFDNYKLSFSHSPKLNGNGYGLP